MDNLVLALDGAIPREVRIISQIISDAGHRCWIVGGCVRDIARGLFDQSKAKASDWDLATTATPDLVLTLFKRVIPTGLEHGTVTIVLSKQHFEVTTLRGEEGHSDGRRPDQVYFVDDLEEDLLRRDLTVNAMAYDVERRSFHDPFSGLDDLNGKLLRAVGDPAARFAEDGLRVLRCARFCATLQFEIEEQTASAIRPSLASFRKVAQERVRDEWFKALRSQKPSRFIQAIRKHGLLEITFPEMFRGERSSPEAEQSCLARLDAAPALPIFRLALLACLAVPADTSKNDWGNRLKLSREESAELKMLINAPLPLELVERPDGAGARRFLSRIGRDAAAQVLAFQEAVHPNPPQLAPAHERLRAELESNCPLSLKELTVGGRELIAAGVPKGPALGNCLQALLEAVLEDPSRNTPATLTRLALELNQASS